MPEPRDNLKVRRIISAELCNENIESCAVEVELLGGTKFTLVGIYRPHSGCEQSFSLALDNLMRSSLNLNELVIITRDFNLDLAGGLGSSFQTFTSSMYSMHFKPLINIPTRFPPGDSGTSPSNLDHIWTNRLLESRVGVLEIDFTDHCPTYIHFKSPKLEKKDEGLTLTFRPFSDDNLENLKSKLVETNWDSLLQTDDPDVACTIFISCLKASFTITYLIWPLRFNIFNITIE